MKKNVGKDFLFNLSFTKDPVKIFFDSGEEGIFNVVPNSFNYPGRGVVTLDLKDQEGVVYQAWRYPYGSEEDGYYVVFYEQ